MQIVDLLIRLQEMIPIPDTRHTYFQSPCKFEDALGRTLPVPSEYDLEVAVLALYYPVLERLIIYRC